MSLVERVTSTGLGNLIDSSRDELMKKDKKFQQMGHDISEAEFAYSQLVLGEAEAEIVEQYISLLCQTRAAYGDISYAAGVRDAIQILNYLGLLKSEI